MADQVLVIAVVGTSGWTQKFLGNPVGSTTYYSTEEKVINQHLLHSTSMV